MTDNPWEAIRRYMEENAEAIIRVEVSSSAGPELTDCPECEAVHPVGMCDENTGMTEADEPDFGIGAE